MKKREREREREREIGRSHKDCAKEINDEIHIATIKLLLHISFMSRCIKFSLD